jgi:hypothetical protein
MVGRDLLRQWVAIVTNVRLAHHRVVRMRGLERRGLDPHLLGEDGGATRGGDETEEWRRWVQRPRAELGVRLQTNEVRVIYRRSCQHHVEPSFWPSRLTWEFEHLHPLALLVLPGKAQTARLELLHERRCDLVPVAVAFPDRARAAVQLAKLAPAVRAGPEHGRAQPEAHRPAHVRARDLGHEDDCGRVRSLRELSRVRAWERADVPRPLDDSELEAEADAQQRDLALARALDCGDLSLGAPYAKTAGDEDAAEQESVRSP